MDRPSESKSDSLERIPGPGAAGRLNPKMQCGECKYLLHCHGDITATDAQQFHPVTAGRSPRIDSPPECHSSMD